MRIRPYFILSFNNYRVFSFCCSSEVNSSFTNVEIQKWYWEIYPVSLLENPLAKQGPIESFLPTVDIVS